MTRYFFGLACVAGMIALFIPVVNALLKVDVFIGTIAGLGILLAGFGSMGIIIATLEQDL